MKIEKVSVVKTMVITAEVEEKQMILTEAEFTALHKTIGKTSPGGREAKGLSVEDNEIVGQWYRDVCGAK